MDLLYTRTDGSDNDFSEFGGGRGGARGKDHDEAKRAPPVPSGAGISMASAGHGWPVARSIADDL
jgi:hypothetical protein